jgi:murein DD-endopeptidase MepM/ murein hydrolase activator NlpD
MAKYLFGMHDPGGEHLFADAKGWITFTEAVGSDPNDKSGRDYRQWADAGYGVIVRLNNGYGTSGTIPTLDQYANFAVRVANFIAASKGCDTWIIGNETNHSQERPQGQQITPAMYVDCFRQVHAKVREIAGTRHGLIPAPVAPWNLESGDWLEYHKAIWRDLWQLAGGVAVHAYTHGPSPALIISEERVQGWHWHFRTYRDQLGALPQRVSGLPAYITESNQGDNAWVDANTGWVQAAYDEIDRWNAMEGTQKIACLCLYRWPAYDRWSIVDKPGIHADMRAAVAKGYQSPIGGTVQPTPPSTPTAPTLPRDIDPRAVARGVNVGTPANLQPGQRFWHVRAIKWFDETQSQGRHHIYVEALDAEGKPISAPFTVMWPSGSAPGQTNERSGFDAGNFPMSPSLNEFSVVMAGGGLPSERVTGIGMGANGNPGIHTSTLVKFELATAPQGAQPVTTHLPSISTPPTQLPVGIPNFTPPQPAAPVPPLAHPIANVALRTISQRFGENPAAYARFGLAGHTGVDFAVPHGTPIGAVDSGIVQESGSLPDYGEYVKVRHPWGESLYAHLSARKVEAGEPVNRGSIIGRSGNTGNSTAPHLHFAIRIYPYQRGAPHDGFSDPLPYLQATAEPAPIQRQADVIGAIKAAASEFGVEWQLLASQAWAESSFNPRAVSGAGAMGLFQIMPPTWDEWALKINAVDDPFHAFANARVGAAYLKWLIGQTEGDAYLALVAYGWGIGNLLSGGNLPDVWANYANKIVHGRDLLKAVGA